MSFYRKYRPQVIGDVDNASVQKQLLSLLGKQKKELPHAFLFSGPRGAGKTTAARLVAKMLNCTKPTKTGPCGTCDQCVSIAEGRNMDVLEIDAASNRGIDEIRQLRDAVALSPTSATSKVYIIDEVHMLTTEAFNALLKTLEEPPAHVVFVLATTDPQKVPVTIKSRCISIVFTRATQEELLHALSRIVKDEKILIDEAGLALIAQGVDGSFRDAVKLLEQVSFHEGNISASVVREMLALSEEKTRDIFLTHLQKKEAKAALGVIADIVKDGKDIKTFLVDCLKTLETTLVSDIEHPGESGWEASQLRDLIRRLSGAFTEMKTTAITQLPLELAVVEFCEPVGKESIPSMEVAAVKVEPHVAQIEPPAPISTGLLTMEKLIEHWADIIATLKPYNHSVAGVMRSARPKSVSGGIVTIEAFYSFHKEKLSESKTRDILCDVLKKLFGEKVKVEIVLGKK